MSWYWIVVISPEGRPFMHDEPFRSNREAEKLAEAKYGDSSRIVPLDTANKTEAAQALRDMNATAQQKSWGKNFKHGN